MNIEFEATFPDTSHAEIRARLLECGGTCIKKRVLYKISAFFLPHGHPSALEFARVRDEGEKVTMAVKWQEGDESMMQTQREYELVVDDYDVAVNFLIRLGCVQKSYQERYREIWEIDDVHIMLDEWPFLEPFIEIEGNSEQAVVDVVEKLGLDYKNALFTGVAVQYAQKYGITREQVNNETPMLTFEKNPFE